MAAQFVDLIKSLAWPLVTAIVVFYFRGDVRALIGRLHKAGPTGVEFSAVTNQATSASAAGGEKTGLLKDFPGLGRTDAIASVERLLIDNLEKQNILEKDKVEYLIRHLAETRLVTHFFRLYTYILGSQIDGLRRLNERKKVSIEEAKEFFEEIKSRNPALYQNFSFEQWLRYLANNNLIRVDSSLVEITDAGRDFLLFLTIERLPENKEG